MNTKNWWEIPKKNLQFEHAGFWRGARTNGRQFGYGEHRLLQCVAACCSALDCAHSNRWQVFCGEQRCCSVLQCVVVCCSVLLQLLQNAGSERWQFFCGEYRLCRVLQFVVAVCCSLLEGIGSSSSVESMAMACCSLLQWV